MFTEYILLLLLTVTMVFAVVGPTRKVLQTATPQLAVRVEKHVMTGFQYSKSHCKVQEISCWQETSNP